MKLTKLYLYILLLIYCFNITILAQSSQIEELTKVLGAQISWNDAKIHVNNLVSKRGDLELKVALAKHAQGDNREDYRDAIIGILRGIL